MKKVFLSLTVIIAFVIYSIKIRLQSSPLTTSVLPTLTPTSTPTGPTPTSDPSATSAPLPTTAPVTSGYRDGQYIGDVTDAFYGNVQVKAVIQGGRITDVQFLSYPNDRRTSIEINSQAMPILTQEAIQAQSAQVDIVSGASATSGAFIQSLQSALSKAKG